jgi:hypothetical protein
VSWDTADVISAYFWMTIAMWIHANDLIELVVVLILGNGLMFTLQWLSW